MPKPLIKTRLPTPEVPNKIHNFQMKAAFFQSCAKIIAYIPYYISVKSNIKITFVGDKLHMYQVQIEWIQPLYKHIHKPQK